MGFTDADRNIMIETHTMVKGHEKRLDSKDAEDDVLHQRINELHGRINTVRNVFTGVSSTITAAGMALAAWIKGN